MFGIRNFWVPTITIGTTLVSASVIKNIYAHSAAPSKFEKAATSLNLTTKQQEALLEVFYLSGYFEPTKLWKDIVDFSATINRADKKEEIFKSVCSSINKAKIKAYSDENQINTKILRKYLFKDDKYLDEQEVANYLLFLAQNDCKLPQNDPIRFKPSYIKAMEYLDINSEFPQQPKLALFIKKQWEIVNKQKAYKDQQDIEKLLYETRNHFKLPCEPPNIDNENTNILGTVFEPVQDFFDFYTG